MKKVILTIVVLIIVGWLLYTSFSSLEEKNNNDSSVKDVITKVTLDNGDLNVKYVGGNMIDEKVSYGNVITKVIEVNNESNRDIAFALRFNEVNISDKLLRFNLSYSYDLEEYNLLKEKINIVTDDNLAFNLVCAKKSKIALKVEFIGNNEGEETKVGGKLSIISNLSEKDIFRMNVLELHSNLLNKITALNGINEKGYFILDINSLSDDIFNGMVLIDASDYSNLKYYYNIYDDKFMLDNYELKNNDINKKYIKDIDNNKTKNLSFDNVCLLHTKKNCRDFNELTYNANGGKDNFYKNSLKVIDKVKKDFQNKEKKVYIYDVKRDIVNDSNIRGYILINNELDNPEYYIYLTNDIYMICGYNLTKLGDYKSDSPTIRMYINTSFNLSAENEVKVCNFSGFNNCYRKNGEQVS